MKVKLLFGGYNIELDYTEGYKGKYANPDHKNLLEGGKYYVYHPYKGLGILNAMDDALSAIVILNEMERQGARIEWIEQPVFIDGDLMEPSEIKIEKA